MSVFALDAKQVQKRSTVALAVPTVPASNDHTDGSWNATDVYSGEMFVNEADGKVYVRIGAAIKELNTGGAANTIYSEDDTVGTGRVVTLTDTLYIDGGTFFKLDSANEGFVYDYANERTGLGVGVPLYKLHVKGDVGDDIVLFEDSAGVDRLKLEDDGKLLTGSGIAATDFGFGQTHRVSGYTTGFAYYSESGVTTNTSIQNRGSAANAVGLEVAFQNNPTGVVRAVLGNVPTTGGTEHIGVHGQSRNGSQYSIGINGLIIGGGGTTPSIYSAAVRGLNQSGVDSLTYGGHCLAQYNAAGLTYTKDMVGFYAEGIGSTGNVLSTGQIVGVRCLTSGTTGTGDRIALHVPDTGNNGSVLFGADTKSSQEALLELVSTTEAFLIMRMTGAQALLITPINGMMLYATSTSGAITSVGFWGYEAGAWTKL